MIDDEHSARLALGAEPRLAALNRAEVLEAADVHVATRLAALCDEQDPDVRLAVALAVRSVRQGAVCVDLAHPPELPTELPAGLDLAAWPVAEGWLAAVRRSAMLDAGVLRLEGSLLYLDRHWREERQVCDDLVARLSAPVPEVEEAPLLAALDRLFPPRGWDEQRDATERASRQRTTVLTGGPGTGKTASVARLLAVLAEQHEVLAGRPARIALAAPTGKAATRLQESVGRERRELPAGDAARLASVTASTLHRLLGWRPDSGTRFRHDRSNPLPYDVVVVDEVSMVSLSQMARLLEAVRPTTRLVLVGDADQLSSVEAGAVLADLVRGLGEGEGSPVVRLVTSHRTADDADGRRLDELAQALRGADGQVDPDHVVALLAGDVAAVRLVDPAASPGDAAAVRAGVVATAGAVAAAAELGDGVEAMRLVESERLLCAHREGPHGVTGWNRDVLRELTDGAHLGEWYAGRPVLVTANDRGLGLSNGDLGVTVLHDGRLRVLVRADGELRPFAPTRLAATDTVYAMTIHKSQGSEAESVVVVLPPADSPLLTRELLYTAVTRARRRLTVLGSEESLRAATQRRVQRASGLAERLRATLADG